MRGRLGVTRLSTGSPQHALVLRIHGAAERALPGLRELDVVRQGPDHSEVIRRVHALHQLRLERTVRLITAPDLKK